MVALAALTFFSSCLNNSLVWNDEFDNSGLPDTTRWNYDTGGHGWGNHELQFYTGANPENARVEDGKLIIEARPDSMEGMGYTSARLTTKNKGDWKYGRIEVRAKLPSGVGVWPAIWMLPTENTYGGWPKSGEIDIMEYVGYQPDTIHGTIHCESFNHMKGTQKAGTLPLVEAEEAFHVYSIDWEENRILFKVDDTTYFTFEKESDNPSDWPFNQPFHLVVNIAVGGSWGGLKGVDRDMFPQTMEVDYVRVYQ